MPDHPVPREELRAAISEALQGGLWWDEHSRRELHVDAVMEEVGPELDARDAEIAKHQRHAIAAHYALGRANQALAAIREMAEAGHFGDYRPEVLAILDGSNGETHA